MMPELYKIEDPVLGKMGRKRMSRELTQTHIIDKSLYGFFILGVFVHVPLSTYAFRLSLPSADREERAIKQGEIKKKKQKNYKKINILYLWLKYKGALHLYIKKSSAEEKQQNKKVFNKIIIFCGVFFWGLLKNPIVACKKV